MDLFDIVISGKIRKEGGGDVSVDALNVTENGVYTASSGHAYSPVTVSVPQGVFPSGTLSITSNGVYDVGSFASADVNVSGGGGDDHEAEDAILTRTISGVYSNSRITEVGYNAFASCGSLVSVDMPNVTKLDAGAFAFNSNLTTVNIPNLESFGSYAFSGCYRLTSANFPKVSNIIASYAFGNCSSLHSLNFGSVSVIGYSAFLGCSSIESISFPYVQTIENAAFSNCKSLRTAYLPIASSLAAQAFRGCSNLMSVYLLSTSAGYCGANTFSGTPMLNSTYTGAFGSIYVPASLVDTYKSKANWSVYSDRITAYEG